MVVSNLDKVFSIVKKHFDLDDKSLKKFEYLIHNPFIDDAYKQVLGNSKDLRKRFEIPEKDLEHFDEGWKIFKNRYMSFISFYNVSYKDFRKNKIIIEKQKIKIKKALIEFYSVADLLRIKDFGYSIRDFEGNKESVIYLIIEKINIDLEYIGVKKLPSSHLSIVLSLNFADWFLCATAERWTSCLNLESSYSYAIWSGLPGLIADKNRAMVYITDGKKKEYNGIKIDRFISRSWVLLDKNNDMNIVKFFPSEILNAQAIQKATNKKFKNVSDFFVSKHKIDLLYFKNNRSSFIYNDKVRFSHSSLIYYGGGGGVQIFDENGQMVDDKPSRFEGGLSTLIKYNASLYNVHYGKCFNCKEKIMRRSESFCYDDKTYCAKCFNENFNKCSICKNLMLKSETKKSISGHYFCQECAKKHLKKCDYCGGWSTLILKKNGKNYCYVCIEKGKIENIVQCHKCKKWNSKSVPILSQIFTEEWICRECYDKKQSVRIQNIKIEPGEGVWEVPSAPIVYYATRNADDWGTAYTYSYDNSTSSADST